MVKVGRAASEKLVFRIIRERRPSKGWELTLHINIHLYAKPAINSPYGKKGIEKLKDYMRW